MPSLSELGYGLPASEWKITSLLKWKMKVGCMSLSTFWSAVPLQCHKSQVLPRSRMLLLGALLPGVAERHRAAWWGPGHRENGVIPMEVAQELAGGAALSWKAGQYRSAQTGWACPVILLTEAQGLTVLDACLQRAALSHSAQASSFALLSRIKAVCMSSSWHPTYLILCALNSVCWAGVT